MRGLLRLTTCAILSIVWKIQNCLSACHSVSGHSVSAFFFALTNKKEGLRNSFLSFGSA